MPAPRAVWPLLLALGCSVKPAADRAVEDPTDTGSGTAPLEWCEGTTAHRWDPAATEDPDMFPDGLLEDPDDSSPTGRRLVVTPERAPWLEAAPDLLKEGFAALDGTSGFGTNGGILLRFDAPVGEVPSGDTASLESTGWMLASLGDDGAQRVPFEAEVLEDGLTVVVWPLVPLPLATEVAFVVTTAATAADGDCIAPAETTISLLTGELPEGAPADAPERHRAAVAALGLQPEHMGAVFPADEEGQADRATEGRIDSALRYGGDWTALGWSWASDDWLGRTWAKHGPAVVGKLARASSWYAERQHVPMLRRGTLEIGRGGALSQADVVLPPTEDGWRDFLSLAPDAGLKFGELDKAARYWWDRSLPRTLLSDARDEARRAAK
jgi:hypothetical protein